MTDCGCDKARRDLEEYLRHEVCERALRHRRAPRELRGMPRDEALVAQTLTDVVARTCQEAAGRLPRRRARAHPRGPGDSLTLSRRAGRCEDHDGARHHVNGQRQGAHRITVGVGNSPGGRQPHAGDPSRDHLGEGGVRALVGARQQSRRTRAPGRPDSDSSTESRPSPRGPASGQIGMPPTPCCRRSPSRGRRRAVRACRLRA